MILTTMTRREFVIGLFVIASIIALLSFGAGWTVGSHHDISIQRMPNGEVRAECGDRMVTLDRGERRMP